MGDNITTLMVKVLDKEYRVSCPTEKEIDLQKVVRYLNNKATEIKNSGKVIGLERILFMTALNICHELFEERSNNKTHLESQDRIDSMMGKINQALIHSE